MTTLNDIVVDDQDYYALSTLTGQPAGTEYELQSKAVSPIIVRQQPTKPDTDDNNGRVLWDLQTPAGYATISGDEEVWLKCKNSSTTARISVETL